MSSTAATGGSQSDTQVRVWDIPTRIFHWLLVALIVLAWASYEFSEALGDPGLVIHRYNGYAVLVLVIWRVLWGVVGPSTARFATFVRSPGTVLSYAGTMVSGRDRPYLGHNPLGGYGVVLILAVVAFQVILGLLSEEHNMTTWGPLSHLPDEETKKAITELHGEFFYFGVLTIAALHVLAVVYHMAIKREPIVRAMITGDKPLTENTADPSMRADRGAIATTVMSLFTLTIAAGLFYGAITLLGGRVFYCATRPPRRAVDANALRPNSVTHRSAGFGCK
ncbi:MAG: cytochrome b/b6 domain-containing protein, partial [Pseudomonadota bacterium]